MTTQAFAASYSLVVSLLAGRTSCPTMLWTFLPFLVSLIMLLSSGSRCHGVVDGRGKLAGSDRLCTARRREQAVARDTLAKWSVGPNLLACSTIALKNSSCASLALSLSPACTDLTAINRRDCHQSRQRRGDVPTTPHVITHTAIQADVAVNKAFNERRQALARVRILPSTPRFWK